MPNHRYKIKLHKAVITEDSKGFDKQTKEKIKKKCIELLSVSPETVGKQLRFELKEYRKLVIFDAYRIIYKVIKEEVIVYILAVGIRRNAAVYTEAIKRLRNETSTKDDA